MAKQRFKITPFINPSGDKVFRVSGTLNGKTIRKIFKTRAKAVAERDLLDVEYLNSKNHGRSIWTTMSHEDNEDAIAVLAILRKNEPVQHRSARS